MSDYEFDIDKVDLESADIHAWKRMGNQIVCLNHPGQHVSFIPEQPIEE